MAGPLIIPHGGTIDRAAVAATGVQMKMPLRLGEKEGSLWLLPIEPLVSVRCRNIIARRLIAKQYKQTQRRSNSGPGGSVKEVWTKDDWEVVISGMFIGQEKGVLPVDLITKLDGLCSLYKPVIVDCALLGALGISQLVVQDLEFTATSGMENQAFQIRAFSDAYFNLLIEK